MSKKGESKQASNAANDEAKDNEAGEAANKGKEITDEKQVSTAPTAAPRA